MLSTNVALESSSFTKLETIFTDERKGELEQSEAASSAGGP